MAMPPLERMPASRLKPATVITWSISGSAARTCWTCASTAPVRAREEASGRETSMKK